MENRSVLETIFWSFKRYFLLKPLLLALLVLAAWNSRFSRPCRMVLVAGIAPMLILWLAFGSYQIRLGLHVLILMQIVNTSVATRSISGGICGAAGQNGYRAISFGSARTVAAMTLLIASIWIVTEIRASLSGYDFDNSGLWVFRKTMGSGLDFIYEDIAKNQRIAWADNALAYGALVHRTPTVRPTDDSVDTPSALRRQLLDRSVTHAVTAASSRISPSFLADLAKACPASFTRFDGTGSEWEHYVFLVNLPELAACNQPAL